MSRRRLEASKPEDGAAMHLQEGWCIKRSGLPAVAAGFFVLVEMFRLGLSKPASACKKALSKLESDDAIRVCFRAAIPQQKSRIQPENCSALRPRRPVVRRRRNLKCH